MRKCLNCKNDVRDDDIYCRNCGFLIQSNRNYIIVNIFIVIMVIGIIFLIALFVASYMIEK